jgi:hypothetical protein
MARKLSASKSRKTSGRGPFVDVMAALHDRQDDPRTVVLIVHGFLELLVNTLIDAKCKHSRQIASRGHEFSHSAKLIVLHEIGCLTDEWFIRLDRARRIRNRAAHDPFFEITSDDLGLYPLSDMMREGRNHSDDSDGRGRQFFDELYATLSQFWNANSKLFSPLFVSPKTEGIDS